MSTLNISFMYGVDVHIYLASDIGSQYYYYDSISKQNAKKHRKCSLVNQKQSQLLVQY